jgi:branched-chain amino acid transport system permease protein
LLISLLIAFVVRGALNFAIEKIAYRPKRLLKLAPGDHRHRHVASFADAGDDQEANYKPYPTLSSGTGFGGAVVITVTWTSIGTTAVSLSVLMWLVHYTKLGRADPTARTPQSPYSG